MSQVDPQIGHRKLSACGKNSEPNNNYGVDTKFHQAKKFKVFLNKK